MERCVYKRRARQPLISGILYILRGGQTKPLGVKSWRGCGGTVKIADGKGNGNVSM